MVVICYGLDRFLELRQSRLHQHQVDMPTHSVEANSLPVNNSHDSKVKPNKPINIKRNPRLTANLIDLMSQLHYILIL